MSLAKTYGLLILVGAVVLTLAPDVSAGTFVAFGPTPYVRDTAAPVAVSHTFTVLDPMTTYTLRIDSGKVSSAIVTLNGVVIFEERDFNANVALLTKSVTLQATNQLTVEMRGKTGESMTLQIIGVDAVVMGIGSDITTAYGYCRN